MKKRPASWRCHCQEVTGQWTLPAADGRRAQRRIERWEGYRATLSEQSEAVKEEKRYTASIPVSRLSLAVACFGAPQAFFTVQDSIAVAAHIITAPASPSPAPPMPLAYPHRPHWLPPGVLAATCIYKKAPTPSLLSVQLSGPSASNLAPTTDWRPTDTDPLC